MHFYAPFEAEEFDDMLVEFKNSAMPSKSEFEATVASVEFMFPRFKGRLAWARMVINGWNTVHIPRHTVPLSEAQAFLVAVHICAASYPRLAVGLMVQQKLGLRPSEMLALTTASFSMPEHRALVSQERTCIIALGQRTGTKAKREQSVVLRDDRMIGWVRWALSLTPHGGRVFSFSYDLYRNLLKRVEKTLGISVGWTPHSPRAGFASDAIARGVPFAEVREAGRWRADSSLRTYIDIVTAAQITVDLRVRGFVEAQAYARDHFEEFLPGFAHAENGEQRHAQGTRREALPPVGRVQRSSTRRLPSAEEHEEVQSGHSAGSRSTASGSRVGRCVHFFPSVEDAAAPAQFVPPRAPKGRGRGKS